jgi:hypothetical protein
MVQKIRALMIIEVAGRPCEYLKEAIVAHINLINGYKGVKLISSSPSEPKKIEETEEMYSCFSEVEIETDDFSKLCDVVFDFMPSSIEVISPSEIMFNLSDSTALLNTLAGRLHKFEDFARLAQIQAQQEIKRIKETQNQRSSGMPINTNVMPSESKPRKENKPEEGDKKLEENVKKKKKKK